MAEPTYPTIKDLVELAQNATRPPRSGPTLAFEVRVRETDSGGEFDLGEHHNTKASDSGSLVLVDDNQDGYRTEFLFFGGSVPPVSRIMESHIEWISTGRVNVYVSEDPDGAGWTQVNSGDPVPFWNVGDVYYQKRLWVKIELVHGTSPEVTMFQIRTLLSEADTSIESPWPTALRVEEWLWKNATPGWWKDILGGYDASLGSLDYRYFQAVLLGLAWARLLLDRGVVRLDPNQALPEDVERLADWANADKRTLQHLSVAYRKKYISNARSLARHRGTKALERILKDLFDTSTLIEWKPDTATYPHRRVVTVSGPLEAQSAKVLLRRHFPASVEIELHYINAAPPVTGFTYTGFDSGAVGEAEGTYYDYGWTLGEGETVELI